MIFRDRQTSNLRELRRATLDASLLAKKKKRRFDFERGIVIEVDSEDESQEISSDSSSGSQSPADGNADAASNMCSSRPSSNTKPQHKAPRRKTLYNGPTIYGSWNNWQPQPLIKVDVMARVLNTKPPPDFLAECKEMGKCRRFLTDVKEMNQKERTFYESRIEAW